MDWKPLPPRYFSSMQKTHGGMNCCEQFEILKCFQAGLAGSCLIFPLLPLAILSLPTQLLVDFLYSAISGWLFENEGYVCESNNTVPDNVIRDELT